MEKQSNVRTDEQMKAVIAKTFHRLLQMTGLQITANDAEIIYELALMALEKGDKITFGELDEIIDNVHSRLEPVGLQKLPPDEPSQG